MGRGEDAPDHVNSTPLLCHHRMLYIDMEFLMTLKNVLTVGVHEQPCPESVPIIPGVTWERG